MKSIRRWVFSFLPKRHRVKRTGEVPRAGSFHLICLALLLFFFLFHDKHDNHCNNHNNNRYNSDNHPG